MEEVTALVLQLGVTFGHNLPLSLPICGTVFLPREVTLSAFQPLSFVGQVGRFDGGAVRVVSILENPHVDADTLLGVLGFRRRVVRSLDPEDGVPLPGRFLLDRDGLDFSVVGQVTVEGERNFTEFREP